jgi:AAA domain-containing protein
MESPTSTAPLKVRPPHPGTPPPADRVPFQSPPLLYVPGFALYNRESPAVPWLVEPLLARGTLFCLNGRGGIWKSWLMTALGLCVATGRPLAGRFACPGVGPPNSVLFIQLEESWAQAQKKYRWMARGLALAPREIMDSLMGYVVGQPFRLSDPRRLDQLKIHIDDQKPDLVLWDSARKMLPGNENSSEWGDELAFHLRTLQEVWPSAHGLVHHWRKKSSDAALNDPDEMGRGNSALRDAVDSWIPLVADPGGFVTMRQTKNRDGENVPPWNYRLNIDDASLTASVDYLGDAGDSAYSRCAAEVLALLQAEPGTKVWRRPDIVRHFAGTFTEDQVRSAVLALKRTDKVRVQSPGSGAGKGNTVLVALADTLSEQTAISLPHEPKLPGE